MMRTQHKLFLRVWNFQIISRAPTTTKERISGTDENLLISPRFPGRCDRVIPIPIARSHEEERKRTCTRRHRRSIFRCTVFAALICAGGCGGILCGVWSIFLSFPFRNFSSKYTREESKTYKEGRYKYERTKRTHTHATHALIFKFKLLQFFFLTRYK